MALNTNSAKIEITAVDKTKSAFDSVKSSMQGMTGAATGLNGALGALGGVGVVAMFTSMAKSALEAADAINDVAKASEVTVASVLQLSEALMLNGGSADNAGKLFASLTNKLDEAAGGSANAQSQFAKVGVTMKDLATLDAQQLFEKTIQGLAQMQDPISRNATAMDLLGKAVKGVDIVGLAADYESSNGKFGDAEQRFKDIGIAMDKVDKAQNALKLSVAEKLAPWYTSTIDFLDKMITGWDRLEASIRKAKNAKDGFSGEWKPSATMNDKPVFGQFNLPKEYQDGVRREVQESSEVINARESAARKAEAARKKALDDAKKSHEAQLRMQKEFADMDKKYMDVMYDYENKQLIKKEKERIEAAKRIEQEEIESVKRIMDIKQKMANENYDEAQRLAEKEAKDYEDIFTEANKNLSRSLTDSIIRGFDKGKSFIQNFKNAITNAFKGYFVNIGVNMVQSGISGVMSSITGSVMNSLGFGNASTQGMSFGGLFSDIKSLFGNGNASIIGGIESIGASISNGLGGIRDTIGGYLGQNASFVANALSYSGAVLQLAQGNFAGAAGTALGTFFGGPVGGAIGSFLGGAIGSLFGGKSYKRYGTSVTGSNASGEYMKTGQGIIYDRSIGGGDALNNINKSFTEILSQLFKAFDINSVISTYSGMYQRGKSKKSGGIFNANIDGVELGRMDVVLKKASMDAVYNALVNKVFGEGLVKAIQASKLVDGVKLLFKGLTEKDQVSKMIEATIILANAQDELQSRFGLTVDQTGKVAVSTGLAGDKLAEFVVKMSQTAGAFATVGDTLTKVKEQLSDGLGGSVPATLKDFDNVLKGIDKTTQAGIDSFLAMFSLREQFAAFTASLDQLKGGVRGALFGIVSDAEKQAMLKQDLSNLFGELGRDVPTSIQELIALGKSIDYTTKEGLDLASVFPTLVGAFEATRQQADALADSLNALDPNNFKSLVDLTRAQRYQDNGISLSNLPSYDVGSSFINGDQIAKVHHGERIIPATDNAALMQRLQNPQANTEALIAEIGRLRQENQAQQVAIVIATQKMAKILDKFDNQGIVLSETDNSGTRIVIDTRTVA